MGKLDLSVKPLTETVDRTGLAFEVGRAGASSSKIGNFFDGYLDTTTKLTNIKAVKAKTEALKTSTQIAQKTAKVAFDPKKLAADSLKADIENKKLQQALIKAKQDNAIQRATGFESAEATIAEQKARVRLNNANASRLDEATRFSKKHGHDLAASKLDIDRQKSRNDFIKNAGDALAGFGGSSDAASQNLPSDLPGGSRAQQQQQQQRQLSTAEQSLQDLIQADAKRQESEQLNKTLRATESSKLATRNTEDNIAANSVVSDQQNAAIQASKDVVNGDASITAGALPITKIAEAVTQARNPEDRAYRSSVLQTALDAFGGADAILEGIDNEITDPETNKSMKSALYKAFALGDPAKLPAPQKTIFDAFSTAVGPEAASKIMEDPEAAYEDMALLLQNKPNDIKSPDLKKVLRNNNYTIAARKASKDGTQGFTMAADRIEGNGQTDLAGQESASQKIYRFTGADGTASVAPDPQTEEDNGIISMYEVVADKATKKGVAAQAGRDVTNDIQSQSQPQPGAQPGAPVGAQPGAQPPVEPVVEDVTAQERAAVGQKGDIATPANIKEADLASQPQAPATDNADLSNLTFAGSVALEGGRLQGISDLDDEAALKLGKERDVQRITFQKDQQTEVDKELNTTGTLTRQTRAMSEIITILEESGLEDFVGTKGKGFRGFTELVSNIPGAGNLIDDDKARILELGKIMEGSSLFSLIQGGVQAKVIDTAKEQAGITAFKGSLDNGTVDLKDALRFALTERSLNEGRAAIRAEAIKLNLSERATNSLLNGFSKGAGKMFIFNPDGSMRKNPEARSAEEYLDAVQLVTEQRKRLGGARSSELSLLQPNFAPREQPTDTGGTTPAPLEKPDEIVGLSETPTEPPQGTPPTTTPEDVVTEPAQGTPPTTTPEDVVTAPTPTAKAPGDTAARAAKIAEIARQHGGTEFSDVKTTTANIKSTLDNLESDKTEAKTEEGPGLIEQATTLATDVMENMEQGRIAEQTAILAERNAQPKDVRDKIEAIKAAHIEAGNTPGILSRAADQITFGIPEKVGKLFGEVIGDITGDETLKLNNQALAEIKQDWKLEHPGQEFAADALAFVGISKAAKMLGSAGLAKLAKDVPALKKSIDLVTGVTAASTTAQRLGQTAAKVTGEVLTDALGAVAVTDEGTIVERAEAGAVGSVVAQAVFGTGGALARPVFKGLKNIFAKPNGKQELAKLFTAKGIPEAQIINKLEQAAKMTDGDFEANVLGLFEGTEREVIEQIFASPAGQTALGLAKEGVEATIATGRKAAKKTAGIADVPTPGAITTKVRDVIESNVDDVVSASKVTAENIQRDELTNIVKKVGTNLQGVTQKSLNRINGLLGRTAPSIKGKVKAGASNGSDLIPNRIANLEAMASVADKSLRGKHSVFKGIEARFSKGFNPEIAKKLKEDLITRFDNRRIAPIIEAVSRDVAGLSTSGGRKIITEPENIQPTFKYLVELRQFMQDMPATKGGRGRDQATEMIKMVDHAVATSFKGLGEDEKILPKLFKEFGTLSELERKAKGQAKFFDDLANSLSSTKPTNLRDDFFKGGGKNQLRANFSEKEINKLEIGLKAYDAATDTLTAIAKGDKSARTAAGLGKNVETALKITGADKNLGKKLINAIDDTGATAVKEALGPEGRDLVSRSVLSEVAERAGNFVAKSGNKVLSKDSFKPKELLGLEDSKWANVKKLLPDTQSKLLEGYFDRTISLNNLQSLLSTGLKATGGKLSTFMATFPRRILETKGYSVFDLATGTAFNTLNKKTQQAIVGNLVDPNPANVNAFIKEVAELMQTQSTLAGKESVVKLTKSEATDAARRIALVYWLGESDQQELKRNPKVRKEREARKKEAITKMLGSL